MNQYEPDECYSLQVEEVTWGYNHPLVDMANSILPDDQKLPELYGYFYGE